MTNPANPFPLPPLVRRPSRPLTMQEQHFHALIDDMVALNQATRRPLREAYGNDAQYALAECTVQVNIGRLRGKTSYIQHRAGPDDLVVVYDEANAREHRNPPYPVVTARQLERGDGRLMGRVFRTVYVEQPTFVFQRVPLDFLYHRLAAGPQQTFIILGD